METDQRRGFFPRLGVRWLHRKEQDEPRKVTTMLIYDLFSEMRDLCHACSDADQLNKYQTCDLMIDAAAIARMEEGEHLFWFARKNGTHAANYIQPLEEVQKFYADPFFFEEFTPIYKIERNGDGYELCPLSDTIDE